MKIAPNDFGKGLPIGNIFNDMVKYCFVGCCIFLIGSAVFKEYPESEQILANLPQTIENIQEQAGEFQGSICGD